jgi:ubiquinol-cytochrome c reductase cytochrome b subunit
LRPELGGYFLEYNNFIPADPLKTPLHIAPVWYFTPFYSMLRAITSEMMYVLILCVLVAGAVRVAKISSCPAIFKGAILVVALWLPRLMLAIDAKFWGVVVMGGAVIISVLPALAGLQPGQVHPLPPNWHKYLYAVFVINFLILGYLGVQPPSPSVSVCRRSERCSTSVSSF